MKYKTITQVAVLASSSCNLNCSYCYLHDQHEGNAYSLLNKEIQQAWIDGSYVENIKKVFKSIDCSPSTVRELSFWGGEPLISLGNMLPSIKDLFKFFDGLTFVLIPTNWTIIKNLIDFLKAIDEALIESNHKEQVTLHLQLSIDGPPGPFNDMGHPGSWDIYRKNISTLCKDLSENPLQELKIVFEVHPTAAKENIFKNLDTPEKLYEYEEYLREFVRFIDLESIKYGIKEFCKCGRPFFCPVVAIPDSYTVNDGLKLDSILNLTNYVHYSKYGFSQFSEHMYFHSLHNYGVHFITERNPLCTESGLDGLTILYDGTICDCPCTYISTFGPYLEQTKNNPNQQNEYRLSLLRRPYFINPITATEKEKENFDWYMLEAIRDTKTTQVSLAMALCQEMALSGQINYAYLIDPELLLKNLYTAGNIFSCPREQVAATKNSFLTDRNDCKKYFNGALHTMTRDRKYDGKYQSERILKWNQEVRQKTENY